MPFTEQVADDIPKVNDDVSVGEDLDFQRRWWRFENAVWIFFLLLLIADLLGLFGRGYLAKAVRTASDQTLKLDYERIERANTPSIMTLHFGPSAVRDGHVRVFVAETVIKDLGAQRISPQPAVSALVPGGLLYTFPATGPAVVEISLQPSLPGRHHFRLNVEDAQPVEGDIVVLP